MKHSDVKKCMADYLEGELPLDSRALLDAHLDECEACSREIAEMRSTISLLRSLPEPALPAGLTDAVMRRIRVGEGRPHLLDRLRDAATWLLAPRILAPLSAAALGAGLALWSGQIQIGPASRSGAATPLQITLASPPVGRGDSLSAARAESGGVALVGRPLGASAAGADRGRADAPAPLYPSGSWGLPGGGFETDLLADLLELHAVHGVDGRFAVPFSDRPPQAVPVASNRLRPAVVAGRDLLRSEDWLNLIEREPAAFADELAGLSLAEQELWIDRLARHALETSRLEQVVAALRESPSGQAKLLADDFNAVAAATDREAAGSNGMSGTPD